MIAIQTSNRRGQAPVVATITWEPLEEANEGMSIGMLLRSMSLFALCAVALLSCNGNSSPSPQSTVSPAVTSPPTSPLVTLSASPTAYTFLLDDDTPEPVSVLRSAASFLTLSLQVADPTVVGVTTPTLSGGAATFSIVPIAHGATTVTATDSTGATTSVSVTTASCGRPAELVAAQQVVPAAGATAVSPTIGTLTFVAYFLKGVQPTGKLHLTVGTHGTSEGGSLTPSTLPPGTVLPTPLPLPIPGVTGIVVSATVPALLAGQQYVTELYNDTCQGAVLAGSFST